MEAQEDVIHELERALNAKINPLKLAETRLENRKMRLQKVISRHALCHVRNTKIY